MASTGIPPALPWRDAQHRRAMCAAGPCIIEGAVPVAFAVVERSRRLVSSSTENLYCGRMQPDARFWSETCRNVQKCTFLHVSDRQNRQSPSPLLLWSDAAGGTFLTCFGGGGGTPPGHS
jgi:hypothetical protein